MKNENRVWNGQSETIETASPKSKAQRPKSTGRTTVLPLLGDHVSRSERLISGNQLVAGLGSHWAGVRASCDLNPPSSILNPREKVRHIESPRRRRKLWEAITASALALALAGCVTTPQTTISGKLNGSPFLIQAPKDGDLAGFDLTSDTNGVLRVHIEHLTVKMNPDVIGQSGAAQQEIIRAAGEAASNITAAAVRESLRY